MLGGVVGGVVGVWLGSGGVVGLGWETVEGQGGSRLLFTVAHAGLGFRVKVSALAQR